MHYQTNLNQINLHRETYVTQIVTLLPWGNLHLNWTTSFHVHKGGWAAESNVTPRGKKWHVHAHPPATSVVISIFWSWMLTVGVAVLPAANDVNSGQHDTKLSVPLLTTLRARSKQQVRHLTGARTVDSESKWQTHHTLHQQQSQTTERQSSAPTPSVSLWCHHPAFPASPHLNSPLTLPTQPQHTTQGGQGAQSRRTTLCSNNVQMFMNFKH